MKIDVPNYERGAIEQATVPDKPIRDFLSWLMTANRYRLEQNTDLTLERVTKLRQALQLALREAENKKAVAAR